jgi:hypothetical protein
MLGPTFALYEVWPLDPPHFLRSPTSLVRGPDGIAGSCSFNGEKIGIPTFAGSILTLARPQGTSGYRAPGHS